MSEYGYKGAQCYYWYRDDDGRMQISNGEWNYFRKKYDGEWDYKKTQKTGYYYEDRNGDGKDERYSYKYWEYEYDENGNHPTVSGDGAALTGGKGDDEIYNDGKSANIKGNAGNDEIYNSGDSANIDGGKNDDYIYNSGKGTIIDGGADKDTIDNSGKSANIKGNAGNDYIYNSGNNVTIDGGGDKDTINNEGASDVKINGGTGDDSIRNYQVVRYNSDSSYETLLADNVKINGGDGNDTIYNSWYYWDWGYYYGGNKVTIDGGKNDDVIYNYGKYAIINGGSGKDNITNGSYRYYQENKDEDYFNEINGNNNEDYILNWLNKVTINGGASDDTLFNHGNRITIDAGTGKDQISNTGQDVKIYATDDNIGDDIFSSGDDVTITAGNGNNTIEIYGENVELNIGGAGKDSIVNYASKIKIETGAEADTITTHTTTGKDEIIGNEVTIDSGTGNDYIWNNSEKASIVSGDNNDKITNFGDSVTIDGGAHDDYIANGYFSETDNEVLLYGGNRVSIVGGSGKNALFNYGLTYAGYDDTEENINKGYFRGYGVTMIGGDDKDTILNSGVKASLDGGKGNDEIINSGASVTAYGGEGYNKITNNGEAVKIIGGADKDTIENSGANVTIYGGEGDESITNSGAEVSIVSGNNKTTIENSGTKVTIDGNEGYESIINSGAEVSIVSGNNKTKIRNTGEKVTIEGSSDADKIYAEGSTLKIDTGGGKDSVTVVATGYGTRDIEVFTGEQEKTNDYVFLQDKGTTYPWYSQRITVNTGLGNDTVWNQGLARATINTGIVGNDSVRNSGTNVSIVTGFGKDTIENYAEYVTINSGTTSDTSKDSIKNHADNVTIIGGDGSDIIQHASAGKVSIVAGKGADVIRVSNITDIRDFLKALIKPAAKVTNEAINQHFGIDITQSLNDVKTLADDNSTTQEKIEAILRLRDATKPPQVSDNEERLIAATGVANNRVYKALSAVTDKIDKIQSNIKMAEVTAEALQEYADSEILKKVAKEALSGFEQDDNGRWVFATSTYTAAKTICGGAGNDKIYSDSFCFNVYEYYAGDGNDVIYNWNRNDTLEVMSGTFVGKCVGNDYVVYVGNGSITFKDYCKRQFKQINTGEWLPLHIYGNGTAYQYERQPADSTYSEPTPPEGISYSNNSKITAENNFSGEIDTSEKVYSADISLIDSSKTSKGVKITGGISSHSAVNASSYSYPTFSSTVWIIGGKGSDEVYSMKQGRVNSGEGNDFVFSYGDKSILTDTDGDDTIVNSSNDTTIEAGKGNDSITNGGERTVFIYRIGDGDDTINGFNETSKLIISGGSYSSQKSQNGNDLIIKVKDGSITLVDAAALSNPQIEGVLDEAKYILNGVGDTNLTLTGGAGNDTIDNSADSVTVEGCDGDDTIYNEYSSDVTIDGGAGDDYINNYQGSNVSIVAGDGDDTVNNLGSYSMIDMGAGNDSIYNNGGNNVSINGGDGKDTVYNWFGTYATIDLGAGDDYIIDYLGHNSTIDGGAGKDTIEIRYYGENISINAGAGNDLIYSAYYHSIYWNSETQSYEAFSADYLTIDGGAGNDSIYSGGRGFSIVGGKGNDLISLDSAYTTNAMIRYKNGDGNDKIIGFNETSVLYISGSTFSTQQVNDDDIIVTVGKGKITLQGAANLSAVNIEQIDSKLIKSTPRDDFIRNTTSGVTVEALGGNDNIENEATKVTINGGDDNDTIYNDGASVSINGGAGEDSIRNEATKVTINGGDDKDSIENHGASVSIDGGAGDDSIRNDATKVTILGGDNNDSIENSGATVSIDGGAGEDSIRNDGSKVTILAGSDNDSIENSGATVSIDGGAGEDSIRNYEWTRWNDKTQQYETLSPDNVTINGGDNNDLIENDHGIDVSISGGNGSDTVRNNGNNVTVSGGAGNDSVQSWGHALAYVYSGGDDTIDGFDKLDNLVIEESEREIERVLDSDGYNTGTVIVKVKDKGTITLNDYWEQEVNIVATVKEVENLTLIENDESNKKIKGSKSGRTMITNHAEKVTISAGTGNTTIQTSGSNVSVVGGKGNDEIYNYEWTRWNDETQQYETLSPDDVTINAGDGFDTVYNYGAGVSINGGSNNDEIYNYEWTRWNDETQQHETLSPDDVTINAGTGNDTVYNYGAGVSINGGSNNDKIYNYGSNSTLNGGAGNDSLWGSDNADTFIYTSGKDVIFGFANDDLLEISGDWTAAYSESKNTIAFKVGSTANAITLKDFTATTFNINGDAYTIRGKQLLK